MLITVIGYDSNCLQVLRYIARISEKGIMLDADFDLGETQESSTYTAATWDVFNPSEQFNWTRLGRHRSCRVFDTPTTRLASVVAVTEASPG